MEKQRDLREVMSTLRCNLEWEEHGIPTEEVPELQDPNFRQRIIAECNSCIINLKNLTLGDTTIYQSLIEKYRRISEKVSCY